MKHVNCTVLSSSDAMDQSGIQIDANQLLRVSFQTYFGDSSAQGSIKIQASNDLCDFGNQASDFVVTNWTDVPNLSAVVVNGSSSILTINQCSYRWLRAVFTNTAMDDAVQQITPLADIAGSLNNTYFLISSIHPLGVVKNFYVWFDNGSGVDPALPGKTGIQIVYSNNDSQNTINTLIVNAFNALSSDFTAVSVGMPTYATWNPSDKGTNIVLLNSNLTVVGNNAGQVRANQGKSSGKWYWECTSQSGASDTVIGVADATANIESYTGSDVHGWGYYGPGGVLHSGGLSGSQAAYTGGDIIGIALDMDAKTVQFYKNGVITGALISGLSSTMYPASGAGAGGVQLTTNFGNTAFAFTPPSGFSGVSITAINTAIVTDVNPGIVPDAADGAVPTNFTFATLNPGIMPTIITVNMNALGT